MTPRKLHIIQQIELCLLDFRSEYSELNGRYVTLSNS